MMKHDLKVAHELIGFPYEIAEDIGRENGFFIYRLDQDSIEDQSIAVPHHNEDEFPLGLYVNAQGEVVATTIDGNKKLAS
jgi:hypothetical protein